MTFLAVFAAVSVSASCGFVAGCMWVEGWKPR
jgi:hypothetical protein